MANDGQHCSFVLLSEFDIDLGPRLIYQFPQPLGTDEGLLANLMLPDGAEKQLEDWTIFFLNQTPFNTIAPVLALETPELNARRSSSNLDNEGSLELLYVLNLVRTKHDKSVKRGAVVKAMAICTRHPFIQIFKPVLLMALDDYFNDPSQDCLARLFDAINSMDLSAAPTLTRHEKLVLRIADRKDVFAEKFSAPPPPVKTSVSSETLVVNPLNVGGGSSSNSLAPGTANTVRPGHRATGSWESRSSFDDGIMMRGKGEPPSNRDRDRAGSESAAQSRSVSRTGPTNPSPEESSFSLDGSAVWVGNESGLDSVAVGAQNTNGSGGLMGLGRSKTFQPRSRSSTDASSSNGHGSTGGRKDDYLGPAQQLPTVGVGSGSAIRMDTHFYQTSIAYKGHQLPIKMPLFTFPEEVGDYSLIQLIQTFSSPIASVQGPLHPHIHTNGALTHPIILLFNALITGKRIVFLGHNRPAGQVSSYVLAACALGSGCGCVLRGFIERAFPYANLINKEEWESIPGYIAGVTNPIFESFDSWDVLCDVGSGRIVISKDIHINFPPAPTSAINSNPLIVRSGTLKAEASVGSEDDFLRAPAKGDGSGSGQKSDFVAKADSTDNLFIEDIISAIHFHFGETLVRARFLEYATRFVRVAARYEEEVYGSTSIGYPSATFSDRHLGSGIVFLDETGGLKELAANASRIEAWRKTKVYNYCEADFNKSLVTNPLQGFDVAHQLWRLRHTRNMPDAEVELIMRTIADNLHSYDTVVELLSYLSPHQGGLLPLSFGLFHQHEPIRDLTVDIFSELRQYPVGVHFLHALNHFHRYAYVRQAHVREAKVLKEQYQLQPPVHFNVRPPSNRSESSLGGG